MLEGPDGPLAFALVLGLLAMAEVTIYADAIGPAMIANLFATLPLALARRHVAWATGAIVFGVLLAISADGGTLTIAALLGLVIVLYLFASTYGGAGRCFRRSRSSSTRSSRSPATAQGSRASCC